MFKKLLVLFIVVPIVELILLVEIGQLIGTLPTIGLIIFTGVLGAYLARRQGLQVLTRLNREIQAGQLPTSSIFDGVIILIAGAFLMTPGILTDMVGFLCLIPPSRRLIKNVIWSRMERALRQGGLFSATFFRGFNQDVTIIDHDDYT